jgi:predicted membrane protein
VSLFRFFEWLGNTSWSIAFHESRYVFLVVLMIHVLTLSVFVGTALMIDLRLLGRTMTGVPVSQVMTRLMPWTQAGFLVMLVTGALLFYAAPVARYENIFFRVKMAALATAVINMWLFRRTVYRRVGEWDLDPVPPRRVRMVGALSLVLLALIITAGRMMAYQDYWFG